ncbi:hypothetical protein C7S20_05535 [Christiangramia fulva]|uniref:GIY-YIG domain-containing protein n=1 Tax=Christiangramia fulva TaxID=2126553 RepID=A0A2R3Z3B9_9FLAO|nr:GIY-YIG nuclease family protein [Christiangramia fulva]AVR44770.1 hypothetical protein C7S20_05535 [Christiangramia fulva]
MTGAATFDLDIINSSVNDLKLKNYVLVKELIEGVERKTFSSLNGAAGVYVFWWVGDTTNLSEAIDKQPYKLKGPVNRDDLITVKICQDWLRAATCDNKICLYVGKSTNLKNRISNHLRYTVKDIWVDAENNCKTAAPFSFEKKPNTVSQLRIGLERIFQDHSVGYIKNHVAISWLSLPDTDDSNNAINRFYIEDKMVSDLFPIFNVDVER